MSAPVPARLLAPSLVLSLLLGCGTTFDYERARRVIRRPAVESVPTFLKARSRDLPVPEGLRATSDVLRGVPLKWDPVLTGDVGGYTIERSESEKGPYERIAAVPGRASTVYVDRASKDESADTPSSSCAALGDGVTCYYRIRIYSPSGRLAARASEIAFATTKPPPQPPAGLRAYSHQPREVPVSWRATADPDVSGYRLYRSPSSRGPFEPLTTIEGRFNTVYLDRELGDLRVFYYRATALNRAGGEGEPSDPVRAVTKPEPLPPVGLRVHDQRLGANRIAWDENVESDLSTYRLFRIRNGSDKRELVASLPRGETAGEDPAVGAGEKVSYTVVALDEDGIESAAAEAIEVKSQDYGLAATVRKDGVHLSWNPRTSEGFRRARITSHGLLNQREVAVVEGATWVDRQAEPGKHYRYSVVLERADATRAPPSAPVEISVPGR